MNVDRNALFTNANDFYEAYRRCWNTPTHKGTCFIPAITCLLFANELYFKLFYAISSLAYPQGPDGHNLGILFKGLPDALRLELTEALQGTTGDLPLQDAFDGVGSAFKDYRYIHEGKAARPLDMALLIGACKASYRIALQKAPELPATSGSH